MKIPKIELVAVAVPPPRPAGRGKKPKKCPVHLAAERLGVKIFEIGDRDELAKICEKIDFDLAIVIAFGMIFPEKILQSGDFLNVHFSLLPAWRGASPVQSAILAGEEVSGITIQKMAKKLDSGDVFLQKKYEIFGKKCSEIWNEFAERTAEILPEFLEKYFAGDCSPTPQNENRATFCGKIEKSDGEIFPNRENSEQIFRKFLAFDFWPGIFVKTARGAMKLTEISTTPLPDSVEISCADDSKIWIVRAQIPGKREMKAVEILRGNSEIFEKIKSPHE